MTSVLTALHRSSSPALRLVLAALLVALTAAGAVAVGSQKTVALTVDGRTVTVTTMKSRVGDIVAEHGVAVGERDDVLPGAGLAVGDTDTIIVRRSRPLQISLDGAQPREVWTTAITVDEALDQLAMTDTAPVAVPRDGRLPLRGMALPVVSAKTVVLNDAGRVGTVRLAAADVGSLLAEAGVPLQQRDTVLPPATTPVVEGMELSLIHI